MSTTAAVVADWLGISIRRVKDLRAAGVLPGAAGDPYDLRGCVRAYVAHMRPATGRNAAGGSGSAAALDAARIQLLEEQAAGQKMRNDQLRAELIPRRVSVAAIETGFANARARLLALPSKAAPAITGLTSPQAIRDALMRLVREVCAELAAGEPEKPSSTRKGRKRPP